MPRNTGGRLCAVLSGALVPCPCCQDAFGFSRPIFTVAGDPLNDIAVCATCGLVYKPVFNVSGVPTDVTQLDSVQALALQPDGRIVAGGFVRLTTELTTFGFFALARYR